VDHRPPAQGLPFLGAVAAGKPIDAAAQDDRLEVDTLFSGPNRFVLQVHGDSMIDDHIQDGDYVVIQQQASATKGARVVDMVDNEVTLKRFYKEKDHIRLEPQNAKMAPIIVDSTQDARVLGVLVGVLRKC